MRRTVVDYWQDEDRWHMPATAKTYRRCTAQYVKKGKLVQCEEAALVPWAKRNDHRGKCKTHGGSK